MGRSVGVLVVGSSVGVLVGSSVGGEGGLDMVVMLGEVALTRAELRESGVRARTKKLTL